jgi:hypothetical protein
MVMVMVMGMERKATPHVHSGKQSQELPNRAKNPSATPTTTFLTVTLGILETRVWNATQCTGKGNNKIK